MNSTCDKSNKEEVKKEEECSETKEELREGICGRQEERA